MKFQLCAAYISKNEESNIGQSIDSVKSIADEIIVLDSGSNDRTCEIAERLGAKVYTEEWKGFVEQKNSLLTKCNADWILFLDCDEILSPELQDEINNIIKNNLIGAYYINRRTHYLSKTMKYSWQPDTVLRLVHSSLEPIFTGGKVHEKLTCKEQTRRTLKHEINHYPYKNIRHHFEKTIHYAELSAESYFLEGKRASIFNLILNPIVAFLNMYVIKMGFRDGVRGLIAAFSSMTGTFLKYAVLFEINLKNKIYKSHSRLREQ